MTIVNESGTQQGPLLIFQNPRSGDRDLKEVRDVIQSRTRSSGRELVFLQPDSNASLEQALSRAFEQASRQQGTVVVSGGDGTINAASSIAIKRTQALGIIPTGTFNFVARSHGIPEETDQAVELLLREPARATRVGIINDRFFLVNSSIGSYARLQHEREGFKRVIGRSRTVASLAAFVSALRPSPGMQLSLIYRGQEQKINCSTLIMCNSRLQLELVGVETLPDRGADELACVCLSPVGVSTQLAMIWKGWQRRISKADEVESFLFDELSISIPKRRSRWLTTAIDGEMQRLRLPLRVGVSDKPLWLIRPAFAGEGVSL